MKRREHLDALAANRFDAVIVGAGINGAVTAAALSAHGLSVALVDRGDFAGFTSQESSNLIWGGFKYLQTYEFGLVRKLSLARNRLVNAYPSSVTPIDFLALFDEDSPFPPALAAAGSFAYWAIGGFATKRPKPLSPAKVEVLEPIVNTACAKGGLLYADAMLEDNDARFVYGFVRQAERQGATIANYCEVVAAEFTDDRWKLQITDQTGEGSTIEASARIVINATGPFVDGFNKILHVATEHRIALSKGIHLIVPRIGSGERVLAFFDEDERLYYVIPMDDRSVIGTTDTKVASPYTEVTDQDREFVLRQINDRLDLDEPITVDDVIAERVGVRPLVVKADDDEDQEIDWLELSRKHEIELDRSRGVVSIFGGKLTDCLNVGEELLDVVEELGLPVGARNETWFGEPDSLARVEFLRQASKAGIGRSLPGDAALLWRRYGYDAPAVLEWVIEEPELLWEDPPFHKGEVSWVGANENVVQVDDFLRRRSSLALTDAGAGLDALHDSFAAALGITAPAQT